MNILGIDIGYSNLKLAYGIEDQPPQTCLRPAGAAPAKCFGTRIDGTAHEDFLYVDVDGQEFVAGVSPDRAELYSRSLHENYTSSDSYKALFHAGLLLTDMDKIDTLITGLPVSQYLNDKKRQQIQEQMQSTHRITATRQVTVNRVIVLPQPIGGYLDYISNGKVDTEDARILVIDPGFFSVDWVVIANSVIQNQSSGTSLNASSVLLEETAKLIAGDYETSMNTESLENAVRKGKSTVMLLGKKVEIAPYLEKAGKAIGSIVAETIQKALRTESRMADIIVLVGGGAVFFQETIKNAFPRLSVTTPDEPVFSNARGFWLMGAAK
ncbi:MAG: ParM/StbA family protein [Nitrosomonas sp.]|uniref:ParM/StbA family protein n=1 Tax=Nitrosomonas aestuarii TaxID=52441 RepID=UPI001BA7668D|nr:ParM/StbA family protein [Nitrosomonas aestuarii]MBX3630288.1 ParM/StbA family protein [Nitrosomonas sp.]